MSSKTLEWRTDFDNLPDEARILTKMKHGIISGTWNAEEKVCRGYYWNDMEWDPYCFIVLEGSE